MIRRMAGLDRDESAAAGCSHLVMRNELAFNDCAIFRRLNYVRHQVDWFIRGRRPQEFDCVISGDSAGRMIETVAFHQMISGGPVAVAVEHGADDATAQHSGERFLISFGLPFGDNFFYPHLQFDAQGSMRLTRGLTFVMYGLNINNEVFGFYNGSPQYMLQREFYKPTIAAGFRWSPLHEK